MARCVQMSQDGLAAPSDLSYVHYRRWSELARCSNLTFWYLALSCQLFPTSRRSGNRQHGQVTLCIAGTPSLPAYLLFNYSRVVEWWARHGMNLSRLLRGGAAEHGAVSFWRRSPGPSLPSTPSHPRQRWQLWNIPKAPVIQTVSDESVSATTNGVMLGFLTCFICLIK